MRNLLLLFIFISSANFQSQRAPVIGIISSEEKEPDGSVIKVTYARFLESAGAIVVPIPWNIEEDRFYTLLNSVNGLLFTGGEALLWDDHNGTTNVRTSSQFQMRLQAAYEFALKMNKEGVHYPLYGICQGMEALGIAITRDTYLMDNYSHKGKLDHVHFTPEGQVSRMFSYYEETMIEFLENNKVMYYWHEYGLNTSVPDIYPTFENEFTITAVGYDDAGKEFMAGAEHNEYPIFMHMFHPERIYYEAVFEENKTHGADAIEAAKSMAKMFVDETMKNRNSFALPDLERNLNIQNFETKVFGMSGTFYVLKKSSLDTKWVETKGLIKNNRFWWVVTGLSVFLLYYYLSTPKRFREGISKVSESSFFNSQDLLARKFI